MNVYLNKIGYFFVDDEFLHTSNENDSMDDGSNDEIGCDNSRGIYTYLIIIFIQTIYNTMKYNTINHNTIQYNTI